MQETEEQKRERRHREDLERLRGFRPIDDTFMRGLFKDNIPLAELVLRIIVGKPDLTLVKCETQADLKRVTGARSICLDAYATDDTGKKYDIEIQRADNGADPHRARYHSSALDIENLDEKQEYRELPDSYVIFITENDHYKAGEPVYVIQNMNLTLGQPFGDGAHILIFRSGAVEVMHQSADVRVSAVFPVHIQDFELMAERTRYLKENPKGVSDMCKVMEELRVQSFEEGRAEGKELGKEEQARATAENFYKMGLSIEQIAKGCGFSVETVTEWLTPKAG